MQRSPNWVRDAWPNKRNLSDEANGVGEIRLACSLDGASKKINTSLDRAAVRDET
jgi:hypothetical protein